MPLRVCGFVGRCAACGGGKRGIHQDRRRLDFVRQEVVDLFRVEVECSVKAELIQKREAALRKLVAVDRCAPRFRPQCKPADACRRLKNNIAFPDVRRPRGKVGDVRRRGELLKALLLLAALRLRREPRQKLLQLLKRVLRGERVSVGALTNGTVGHQVLIDRQLHAVVGVLDGVRALGHRAAVCLVCNLEQTRTVESDALFDASPHVVRDLLLRIA